MNNLHIDNLSGIEFEEYLMKLFENLGYNVEITPASNDYGADLVISKNNDKTVVQAKRYNSSVGVSAIQEIVSSKSYYQANKCMVVTNNYFTPNAIELAKVNDVELWDRNILIKMITLSLGDITEKKSSSKILFQDILESNEYKNVATKIPLILGQTELGELMVTSLDEMPHLLIAGATGTGKSMFLHALIIGILNKSTSDDVKLLLIDPKVVELNIYNGIPHLLIPVVTDQKKAASSLNWTVEEMERRYKLFAHHTVRDITSYNNLKNISDEKLYNMVIIIDELANLNTDEIKKDINKITQMGRATGIYLIATTQIPNIANTFKNDFPSRIAFRVFSQSDSKLIIDEVGAEKLSAKGDMLFSPINELKPIKMKCAFINETYIESKANSFKMQNSNQHTENSINTIPNNIWDHLGDKDELSIDAIALVIEEEQASISLLQRRLNIGYARAARLIDEMEQAGVIGGFNGSSPRKVLLGPEILNNPIYSNNVENGTKKHKLNYLNPFNLNGRKFIKNSFFRFMLFPIIFSYYLFKIFLFLIVDFFILIINSFTYIRERFFVGNGDVES